MYSVLNNKLSHKIAKPNKSHKNTFCMSALQYNTDIDKQKQLMNMCLSREGIKKGKVFPYSLLSVGPRADPGVQAVSPQVT